MILVDVINEDPVPSVFEIIANPRFGNIEETVLIGLCAGAVRSARGDGDATGQCRGSQKNGQPSIGDLVHAGILRKLHISGKAGFAWNVLLTDESPLTGRILTPILAYKVSRT